MDKDPKEDQALEALFDAARAKSPVPEPQFIARLRQDMEAALPSTHAPASTPTPSLMARLGGLFAASGLTGAAALGVWIGFVMPETLTGLTDGLLADQTVSLSSLLPAADLAALSE